MTGAQWVVARIRNLDDRSGKIRYCSIYRFKGLEARAVILTDIEKLTRSIFGGSAGLLAAQARPFRVAIAPALPFCIKEFRVLAMLLDLVHGYGSLRDLINPALNFDRGRDPESSGHLLVPALGSR